MKVRRAVAVLVSRFPLITETFILREIQELERQGQPVRLVPLLREHPDVVHPEALPWISRALYSPYLSAEILAANLRCLRRTPRRYLGVLARVLGGTLSSRHMLLRSLVLFPKCVYLAQRLREEGVDHLHAHFATHPTTAALIISRLTGIPFSFTVHAHDIFVHRALLAHKIRAARFVRSISDFNRRFLLSHQRDAPSEKIAVIHTGVDVRLYANNEAESEPEPDPPVRLLCVASLKPYKGIPVLLRACRRLKDDGIALHCDIVGDGPLRGPIERLIASLALEDDVHLRGALPEEQVARLMSAAWFVVQPSVVAPDGQMEGIPVALMEALAAGRPVVASWLSGIPELVEDGVNGKLVPPGDADALAGALRTLLAAPDLGRRMGEQGRRKVEAEFHLKHCVAALLERFDTEAEAESQPAGLDPDTLGWLDTGLRSDGPPPDVVGLRRIHRRADSRVLELVLPGRDRPRHRVLKRHSRPESARHEFETLTRLQDLFGQTGVYGVPRPHGLCAQDGLVLMSTCRGRPLDEFVRRSRWPGDTRDRPALLDALRRSGGWLRAFQDHTRQDSDSDAPRTEPAQGLMERARADLALCARHAEPRRFLASASANVASLRARAAGFRGRTTGHHGDFWPGNVYVDDARVEVIDFEGYGLGLPYEDPATFLTQLELYYTYPGLRTDFAPLADAFLAGYLDATTLDPALWAFCRALKSLQILAQSLEKETLVGARGRHRRRALRRMVLRAES